MKRLGACRTWRPRAHTDAEDTPREDMATSRDRGASAKKLRVLLPFTIDSLRIPDDLAEGIGAAEVRVVGSSSGGKVKVWRVEVGRDGDGAFLGSGWPEFVAACGVELAWLLLLQHHGGGVLTLKAFDASGCIRDLGTPPAEATTSSKGASHRPQFVSVLSQDSMEKMMIPDKFVQHYIREDHKNTRTAIIIGSHGKIFRVELEMFQSNLFFRGGWSLVLASHDITRANALLLKYEGNMVFTVKVFGPDGCQREFKDKDIRIQQASTLPDTGKQQEAPSESIQNRKSKKDWPSREGQQKKPKGYTVSMKKASKKGAVYEVGPQSWIQKEINTSTLRNKLSLPKSFCDAIGLREPCIITLKMSMNSVESWQVTGLPCKNNSFVIVKGWRMFCRENSIKEGEICTFNIVETTLWHVVITHCNKEKMKQFCYESPSASSRELYCSNPKRKNNRPSSGGQKRPEALMTCSKKSSPKKRCVYDIGPPAWIKKEINDNAIQNYLALPKAFCVAIGLREPGTITLKTSISSTSSWQVCCVPYKNSSHNVRGLDWKRFCEENEIKIGDVCTFNIVETTLWHVVVERQ
ncbi:unnamed protein product [Urochloa decumbens]|uniref:TF-B3 domain-containing protein n=1 Tax=Urochloa decumbens TaxID=240449 RepID=A0ABC9CZA3_9POAL